jgi:hypothetical protein
MVPAFLAFEVYRGYSLHKAYDMGPDLPSVITWPALLSEKSTESDPGLA